MEPQQQQKPASKDKPNEEEDLQGLFSDLDDSSMEEVEEESLKLPEEFLTVQNEVRDPPPRRQA